MNKRELDGYHKYMHHHVVVTKNDGSTAEGHIQPWSETTVYLTPLTDSTAQCIQVAIADIKSIDVKDE